MAEIIDLFPKAEKKFLCSDKLNDHDIQKFLDVLDESLETFFDLSPHQKFSLYKALVDFTHTSLGVFMKGEEV